MKHKLLERPVEIAEDLDRRADTLRMLGEYILIECNDSDPYTKVGSLFVPLAASEVYPTSGWVINVGPKVVDLSRGDFVLIEEEGTQLDATYYDVFEILLRMDDGSIESIYAELEVEIVLRDEVSKFRRGAGPDSQLSIKDLKEGESISFNCSDVVDWQFGDMANPSYDLTYVPVHMYIYLNEDDEPALFYITKPAKIISTLEY
jgi:hypothetical protein